LLLAAAILLAGCQGQPKSKPPIHINPNMDNTPRYEPQEASPFWEDGMVNRHAPEGTVARGELREDRAWYEGVGPDGRALRENPLPLTASAVERGRERYDIFCSACHSRVGDGRGIVTQRGYVPPPSFHTSTLREVRDGHIFQVISDGIRNMPAYAPQIPVEDRWRIVHYVRALQRSQHADMSDVPEQLREGLR
jgi:mono/diheme cytochrome c family protein